MWRFFTALAAGVLSVLLVVPAAIGKEGVHARLDTSVPLEAAPGKAITIAWTLSYADRGSRRPFGASGVFVQVMSASGGAPAKAVGQARARGRYVAEVTIPAGGIGAIKIGLEGTRFIGGRSEDADIFFPIDNDPFAPDSRSSAPTADAGQPPLVWLGAGALAALGVILTIHRAHGRRHGGNPA